MALTLPAGAALLVDTNPIIYVLEGNPLAKRFAAIFAAAEAGEHELVVTPITLAEVVAGPLRHGHEALAERYSATLQRPPFRLCEIGAEIAFAAARLRIRYRLKLPDAIQVAAALHEGCHAIVTHDRDFSAVTDLRVVNG